MIKHIKTFCDEYKISVNAGGVITLSADTLKAPSVIETSSTLKFLENSVPGDVELGSVRVLDVEYSDKILSNDGTIIPGSFDLVPTIGVVETYVSGRLGEYGELRSENGEVVIDLSDSTQYTPASMSIRFGSENFYITEDVSSLNGLVIQTQDPFEGTRISNYGGVAISPTLRLKYPNSGTEVNIHEDGLLEDSVAIYAKPNTIDTGVYVGIKDGVNERREEIASTRRALVYGIIF